MRLGREYKMNRRNKYEVDFRKYDYGEERINLVRSLPKEYLEKAKDIGVNIEEGDGAYFQIDHNIIYRKEVDRLKKEGVIIMSIKEALEKLKWVKGYYWKALRPEDEASVVAEKYRRNGYFIYIPPGVKLKRPIQTCLLISRQRLAQPVHNVIIVGDGAEATLITGCTALVEEALHIGVSEFYVGKDAKMTFIMIHNWSSKTHVRPRTGVIVEDGGIFVNYYINMRPGITLQMMPKVILHGGARAYLTSIIRSGGDALVDIGGRIVFVGNGSRGEIVTRSIIADRANVIMRGILEAKENVNAIGHLECRGLLLSDKAKATAIPQLESKSMLANLTHEAAIGRISDEELNYLMAKGFTEEEAVSIIVRGFLETGLELLPENVRLGVKMILDAISKGL